MIDHEITPLLVAGTVVWAVASALGVFAVVLRERSADAYWFAALLGLVLVRVDVRLGEASIVAEALLLTTFLATGAMWLVSRRRMAARPDAATTDDPLPRWEAAAWAAFMLPAAQLGAMVLIPIGALAAELMETRWLVDQCLATSEVDLHSTFLRVCDAARHFSAFGWLYGLASAGIGAVAVAVWLFARIAPRGRRLRLAGFVVLFECPGLVVRTMADGGGIDLGDAATLSVLGGAMALGAWAAFRPARAVPRPTAANPSPTATAPWRRRVAIATLTVVVSVGVAGVIAFQKFTAQLRSTPQFAFAVSRVRTSDEAMARLGRPIEIGATIAGSTGDTCGHRYSVLFVPVAGPRGEARLKVSGAETPRGARFGELSLLLPADADPIDLRTDAERAMNEAWLADRPVRDAARDRARDMGANPDCAWIEAEG